MGIERTVRAEVSSIGVGRLSRAADGVYRYATIAVLLVVTTLPGAVSMMLLDRSLGNAPLFAACMLPFAPAISAGIFALSVRSAEEGTLRSFLRGYRLNAVQALTIGAAALGAATIIAIGALGEGRTELALAYHIGLAVLAACLAAWTLLALVMVSLFHFRTRDVARLAIHYTFRLPLVGLGALGTLVVALGIVGLTFDVALAVVGPALLWMLRRTSEPLIRDVKDHFVRPASAAD